MNRKELNTFTQLVKKVSSHRPKEAPRKPKQAPSKKELEIRFRLGNNMTIKKEE